MTDIYWFEGEEQEPDQPPLSPALLDIPTWTLVVPQVSLRCEVPEPPNNTPPGLMLLSPLPFSGEGR